MKEDEILYSQQQKGVIAYICLRLQEERNKRRETESQKDKKENRQTGQRQKDRQQGVEFLVEIESEK